MVFDFGDGYLPQIGDTVEFITAGGGVTIDPANVNFFSAGFVDDFTYDVSVNGSGNLELTATSNANAGNDFIDGDQFGNIIAGGTGNFACEALDRWPDLKASVLDLPAVAELADQQFENRGLKGRARAVVRS